MFLGKNTMEKTNMDHCYNGRMEEDIDASITRWYQQGLGVIRHGNHITNQR